jgi:hypothetical protein
MAAIQCEPFAEALTVKKTFLLTLVIGFMSCLQGHAADVTANNWDKRFTLRGGVIAYNMSGDFSSSREDRPTINLDLDDLDLQEKQMAFFLGGALRMGDRWRLSLDYFHYDDNGSDTAKKYFEFNDLIVNVGVQIKSRLSFDLYVVNLGYDIYRSERAYFGAGIGAHVVDFDMQVSAKINVDADKATYRSEDEDLTAPLPNLYAGGAYAFRDDVIFHYGGGWMSLSYGDYDGELLFAQGTLEYWPFQNVGLGAGYAYRTANIEYKADSKKEKYDIEIPGPILYLTVGF